MTSRTVLKGLRKQKKSLEKELEDLKDAIAQLSDRKRTLTIELKRAERPSEGLDLTLLDASEEENFVEFFSKEDSFLEETRNFLLES